MVFKVSLKFIKLVIVSLSILMLVGCSGIFRNREFDYSREDVILNPPLNIPDSIGSKVKIKPKLVIPFEQSRFSPEGDKQPYDSLLPPNFNNNVGVSENK